MRETITSLRFETKLLTKDLLKDPFYLGALMRLSLVNGHFRNVISRVVARDERFRNVYATFAHGDRYCPVGVLLCQRKRPKNQHGDADSPRYEIGVFVDPEYRRRGVGAALVRFTRSRVRRELRGSPWNKRAEKFFDALRVQ
jgi:GNAT superfamily N-acetyltransferase